MRILSKIGVFWIVFPILFVCLEATLSGMALAVKAGEDAGDSVSAEYFESKSKEGIYVVSIWPENGHIEVGKMQRWGVRVLSNKLVPVYPVKMSIGGGMETHKHGLPTQPQLVAYGGEGIYLIDGVRFNMAGAWRLSLLIESEFGIDQADFDIDVQF